MCIHDGENVGIKEGGKFDTENGNVREFLLSWKWSPVCDMQCSFVVD